MNLVRKAMFSSLLSFLLLTALPVSAHEGHDHGDGGGGTPQSATIQVAEPSLLKHTSGANTLAVTAFIALVALVIAALLRILSWANRN